MNLYDIYSHITAGGVVSVLIIILSLVEITPIPIHPLAWVGKRINGEMLTKVDALDKKLNEHMAKSYRATIFDASEQISTGGWFTEEQWNEWLDACDKYETHCKDNNVKNGKAKITIKFIRESYESVIQAGTFVNLPVKNES